MTFRKGKPVARQGRKAIGSVLQIAWLPKIKGSAALYYVNLAASQKFDNTEQENLLTKKLTVVILCNFHFG
jgi:hypothetical protein